MAHRLDRFVDGLHPNDLGFAEYAAGLDRAICKAGIQVAGALPL
ncbi:MAG: hypothetical protein PF961_11260 [Planctomycetota bacterium]|nr:hypothetical protein [Planctomycetota bacterium]